MAESPYWNPRHETMARDELDALQVRKLRNLVEWTDAQVPFHSKRLDDAGVTADSIKSLDDLQRIPFMTRDEWMQGQLEHPPYGPILAAPEEAAIRYHLTSGTTGKTPIRVLDSMKDWEWIAEMWCYGFWGFGVRPADVVFFAFSYGTFVGFWGAHYACEKIGCLVLPGGNMTTEARVKQIVDMNATVVCSTPTYALRMAQEARDLGIDLANGPGEAPHPLGRAGRFDPRDEEADRGAVGREGRRHGRDDRARHDHDVRVRAPARRRAHHRGPLHRGGDRPRDAASRSRYGERGRARRHLVRPRLHPGDPLPHARPRPEGARHARARAAGRSTSTTAASGAGSTT